MPRDCRKPFATLAALFLIVPLYAWWPVSASPSETADEVVVHKQARTLTLFRQRRELKTYKVSLGHSPVGPKTHSGDHRTPEGDYVLDGRNPQSRFHLALHVSYPNAADAATARGKGVLPGGDIMVHGLENGLGWIGRYHRFFDWTDGCIAVTNAEIDQLWQAVPIGTPIHILP